MRLATSFKFRTGGKVAMEARIAAASTEEVGLQGTTAFKYVTEGEVKAIEKTRYLRGGNAGETYYTKDLYKSATRAENRLALPFAPTHRLEFEFLENPFLQNNGTKVLPGFGQPGQGSEFMTNEACRVKILNVQLLIPPQ